MLSCSAPRDSIARLQSCLGKSRVRVSFLDYYGNFAGALEPSQHHDSGSVHLAQARIILDEP
jgi:CRISPR-associated protein Cas1